GRQAQPARREHAQEVGAREEQHVLIVSPHPEDHTISAGADVLDALSARTAIAEELPVRTLLAYLRRAQAFVLAIVPLDQVGIDHGHAAKAGQLAGAGRALQGARPDMVEVLTLEALAEAAGVFFAARRQWQVGQARVLPGEAPGRLAVASQVDRRK